MDPPGAPVSPAGAIALASGSSGEATSGTLGGDCEPHRQCGNNPCSASTHPMPGDPKPTRLTRAKAFGNSKFRTVRPALCSAGRGRAGAPGSLSAQPFRSPR